MSCHHIMLYVCSESKTLIVSSCQLFFFNVNDACEQRACMHVMCVINSLHCLNQVILPFPSHTKPSLNFFRSSVLRRSLLAASQLVPPRPSLQVLYPSPFSLLLLPPPPVC